MVKPGEGVIGVAGKKRKGGKKKAPAKGAV